MVKTVDWIRVKLGSNAIHTHKSQWKSQKYYYIRIAQLLYPEKNSCSSQVRAVFLKKMADSWTSTVLVFINIFYLYSFTFPDFCWFYF